MKYSKWIEKFSLDMVLIGSDIRRHFLEPLSKGLIYFYPSSIRVSEALNHISLV